MGIIGSDFITAGNGDLLKLFFHMHNPVYRTFLGAGHVSGYINHRVKIFMINRMRRRFLFNSGNLGKGDQLSLPRFNLD
ncbi:MAG: hypothetical protein BWY71_02366 [Planctomycetes bacterium ADurb.Bin412]|nr:MAG: hypothetical protein BWY71_02366 [Planctomycetes bacterium ADurb.Bin412]